mmetsp:Transcript_73566/g.157692  ORF Transcript_73566/g.157692 Transcript_73566/m.157692 type:complete len:235 (-) Transcript_73566:812-1516(-)
MAGCRVDEARTALRGDVVTAQDHRSRDTGHRVLVFQTLEDTSLELGLHVQGSPQYLLQAGDEAARNDEAASPSLGPRGSHNRVLKGRVHGNGPVGRDCPGRRCPHRHLQASCVRHRAAERLGRLAALETNVDGLRGVLFRVFQLRFCEGRPRGGRPIDGLPATIDVAAAHHLFEDPQLGRLITRQKREVGVIEVAPDAVTLKGLPLLSDGLAGEIGCGLPELERRQLPPLLGLH